MKWKFKILFGWDLHRDLIDVNLFTIHLEEMVRWVEIIGCVFYWEREI